MMVIMLIIQQMPTTVYWPMTVCCSPSTGITVTRTLDEFLFRKCSLLRDEAEKPRFSNTTVRIVYMLAWYLKFLAILHIWSAQWRGVDLFELKEDG